ncbi:heat shock protein Hsp33 [Ochromonadaceae sp. CCMP2298]|nr:heat shock protein Hsp33 [Ochromonadaceae sp. CCMP2298]
MVGVKELLGEGQVQVVRNHPSWKTPMNGITELRDTSISLNLAMYMSESEQRPAAIVSEVNVQGNLCRYSLGVMVERLPGCSDENMERSIKNLEAVSRRGLRSYLDRPELGAVGGEGVGDGGEGGALTLSTEGVKVQEGGQTQKSQWQEGEGLLAQNQEGDFRSFEAILDKIMDDCLDGMDEGSLRWGKSPQFRCSCGIEKVWRTLRLLPADEIESIVTMNQRVEMKCEFCGEAYGIEAKDIQQALMVPE